MSTEMQSSILTIKDFTVDKLKYSTPKINKHGGKAVKIPFMLEAPSMMTWGASQYVDEKSGNITYKMSLQFPRDDDKTPETDMFLKKMIDLETKIKSDATTNSIEWFNKPKDKMSEHVVDALFNPLLKYPKDPVTKQPDTTRAPTLDLKLDCYDDKFSCELFNKNGKMIFPNPLKPQDTPLTLIPKYTIITPIIQSGGVYFVNGKFGLTLKFFQGVPQQRPTLKGKCLVHVVPEVEHKNFEEMYNNEESKNEVLDNTLIVDSDNEDNSRNEDDHEVEQKEEQKEENVEVIAQPIVPSKSGKIVVRKTKVSK